VTQFIFVDLTLYDVCPDSLWKFMLSGKPMTTQQISFLLWL